MGAAAVVIIFAQERKVIEAFAHAGATAPATAQSLAALGIADGRMVRRLRDQSVLREAAPGIYYVDLELWRTLRRTRQRLVLVLAIVVLAVAVLLGVFGPRHG